MASAYDSFTNGWIPANAKTSSAGNMVCCTCGKAIEGNKDYQYRQKTKKYDWYYQTQHRECATNQQDWERLDKERELQDLHLDMASDIAKEAGLDEDGESAVYELLQAGWSVTIRERI